MYLILSPLVITDGHQLEKGLSILETEIKKKAI
jgi:hypothetical protein